MKNKPVVTDQITWRQQFREDFHDYPATMALGGIWIVVFAAMLVNQGYWGGGLSWKNVFFGTGSYNGLRFGGLTLRDLYAGEVWRLLTATFVHFGLIHITINLLGFYQLGCLVESWYGPGPFLAIYVLTGAGGNFLSALVRHSLKTDPALLCAGGSTVIMGLVGLCALVGWILRSRTGDHLRNQMLFVIILTAGIGIVFWAVGLPVIDNWGHAGGTVVGALIGLSNAAIVRLGRSGYAKAAGWVSLCLIVGSGAAQVKDGRTADSRQLQHAQEFEQAKYRFQVDGQVIKRLEEIRKVYRVVALPRAITRGAMIREMPRRPTTPSPAVPPATQSETPIKPTATPSTTTTVLPAETKSEPKKTEGGPPTSSQPSAVQTTVATPPILDPSPRQNQLTLDPELEFQLVILGTSLRLLSSLSPHLDTGESSADLRRAQLLLARTMTDFPSIEEVREFDDLMHAMIDQVRKDRDEARDRVLGSRKQ